MTAYTPDLPALVAALPDDDGRAPQTSFDRARQVVFLERLSVSGSVRTAASAAGVSHQSAYRARRGCRHFALAWDGALVAARVHAADMLACRAIDGVEEKVFFRGEEVGSRTRYSDRLLLAHLARLDRLATSPAAAAYAADWDASQERFAKGEDICPPQPQVGRSRTSDGIGGQTDASGTEKDSPGPWSKWSMFPPLPEDCDEWTDDDQRAEDQWQAMAEARPQDAPPPELLGDLRETARVQAFAFEMEDENWFRLDGDCTIWRRDEAGRWTGEMGYESGEAVEPDQGALADSDQGTNEDAGQSVGEAGVADDSVSGPADGATERPAIARARSTLLASASFAPPSVGNGAAPRIRLA